MSYGMIGYHVSLDIYPDGYHCNPEMPLPYLAIAAQKKHLAVYMMGLYTDADDAAWFEKAWKAAGKKLNMGKSCVRFQKLDDVPLDVLAEAIRRMPTERYVAAYEASLHASAAKSLSARRATAKKKADKAPRKQAKQRPSGEEVAKRAIARRMAKK